MFIGVSRCCLCICASVTEIVNGLLEFVIIHFVAIFAFYLFAVSFHHFELSLALRFDCLVSGADSIKHNGFRHFFHLTFNHHDVVERSCNHELKVSLFALFKRRVDNHLTIDASNAYFGDRTLERYIRASECSRGSQTSNTFRHVNTICGIKCYVYESFCMIISREEWAKCTVNESSNEDFIVGSFSFAACETTWEATCTGKFFFVLHGQRHKVRSGNSVFCAAYCGKHHCVAERCHHCTVGLFSQFSGFQFNDTSIRESNLLRYNVHKFFTFCGRLIASG